MTNDPHYHIERAVYDKWHERINDISDLCNTTVVTDRMSRAEVVELLHTTLAKIYALADYPPEK